MSKRLVLYLSLYKAKRPTLATVLVLILILLAACSPEEETPVEVTRVVVETVTVEGEPAEVTRVIVPPEAESAEEGELDPPAATGSEGDAEPLPSQPNSGPKVAGSRGSTPPIDRIAEAPATITLRASQVNTTSEPQQTVITATFLTPTERQKQCHLVNEIHKKHCGS